jgi:hypothetical protein
LNTYIRSAVLGVMGALTGLAPAHADLASDSTRVLEHRLAMAEPRTVFEKWQADQWTFAASECLAGATAPNFKARAKLDKLPIYRGGSYSSARDLARTCATLAASGPVPVCFELNSRQKPFAMPRDGLPSNYVFLASRTLPAQDSEHVVGGACQLVMNKPETNQFFAGPANVQWVQQPKPTQVQTASGARSLTVGTLQFKVQGMPGSPAPLTVVLP